MTTSWAHVVRGQFPSAVRANAGGTLLALVAIVGVPWTLISAVRGRLMAGRLPVDRILIALAIVVSVVTLADWVRRLLGG